MLLLAEPPDSTLASEIERPERKRPKSISVPELIYVLIYHCYGDAKDLFPPAYESRERVVTSKVLVTSTNLPDRY